MNYMPTYYEILGLPEALQDDPTVSAQTLRNAYRRALLQNHPDKLTKLKANTETARFSVDQISEAFSVLSKRESRSKYDAVLKQKAAQEGGGGRGRGPFHIGIETADLDDLDNDEVQGIWYRSCRCGDERGFLIREADLAEAEVEGEIRVGCRGCSLWLKVLFGVMDERSPEEDGDNLESTRKEEAGKFSSLV